MLGKRNCPSELGQFFNQHEEEDFDQPLFLLLVLLVLPVLWSELALDVPVVLPVLRLPELSSPADWRLLRQVLNSSANFL